ncbi:MAG TPA: chromate efflux transporter, partial [Gemmatimonadales bacterium]|nr:chromate efflux transporter [Gemmatimonadales bacterium]
MPIPLPDHRDVPPASRSSLWELARLYLKLGTIAFGGPAAHIALFEHEVVGRRRWVTREQFLDYLGLANLIPGPSSTEMAIFLGQARAGFSGLIVAGACFILPAALLVGILAWAYTRFGTLPAVAGLLYGVKPVVIAIVLQALLRLGRSALQGPRLAALGVAAAAANALGGPELAVLLATGAAGALFFLVDGPERAGQQTLGASVAPLLVGGATAGGAGLGSLFLVFLKIGATVFGSGYVLLAFLQSDIVVRHHWLTESQLLDAVAVGQVTPGPVFTTATFVGYLVAGA